MLYISAKLKKLLEIFSGFRFRVQRFRVLRIRDAEKVRIE
jgi:hypothetical protein